MRKLKKTLAVLLVLVLSFAMIPFAVADDGDDINAAADFADFEDVTQHRDVLIALDVLAATGVVRGHDGGVLDPQTPIIRAEAASIVARVLLGPDVADSLPRGMTGFRDVDGDPYLDVHSGAIAYLHERGIVVGTDSEARLFSPRGQVTGAQLAVMFLRAVGFGVNGEYEGTHFRANSVVDGTRWRILRNDVFDVDHHQPATREMVLFYAYNALNTRHSPVGLRYVNWSADRQDYVPVMLQGAFPALGDQLGLETIYRRVFTQSPINLRWSLERDVFGRPADRYTLRGTQIVLSNREAAATFTTADPFGFVVPAALGGLGIGPVGTEIPVFVQGTLDYVPEPFDTAAAAAVAAPAPAAFNALNFLGPAAGQIITGERFNTLNRAIVPGGVNPGGMGLGPLTRASLNARVQAHTGNGVLVEVFVDEATNYISAITVIRTDISRIFATSPFSVTVTTKIHDRAAAGLQGAQPWVSDPAGGPFIRTGGFGSATSLSVGPTSPYFAALRELSVGDSVLVSPALGGGTWALGAMAVPEVVTGALSAVTPMTGLTSTGSMTIGGTSYSRAMILTPEAARASLIAGLGSPNLTVLLDEFNNVVDVAGAYQARNRDLLIVQSNGVASGPGGRPIQTVTGFHPDSATPVTINMTARDHIPVQPGGFMTVPDGAGGTTQIQVPQTLQAMINLQGATIGAVIRLVPNPVLGMNWTYVNGATPSNPDDLFGLNPTPPSLARGNVATANATVNAPIPPAPPIPVGTTELVTVSLSAGRTGLVPNQSGLILGGGRNLQFAPDARYFFVTYRNANAAETGSNVSGRIGVVQSLDRNRPILGNANFSADGFADTNRMIAVVEHRGLAVPPVITALWIGAPAIQPDLLLDNVVFLGDRTGGFVNIPGNSNVPLRWASDARGGVISGWDIFARTGPEPSNWIWGAGGAGFFLRTSEIDEHGRFSVRQLGALERLDNEIFQNMRATANGLRHMYGWWSPTHFMLPLEVVSPVLQPDGTFVDEIIGVREVPIQPGVPIIGQGFFAVPGTEPETLFTTLRNALLVVNPVTGNFHSQFVTAVNNVTGETRVFAWGSEVRLSAVFERGSFLPTMVIVNSTGFVPGMLLPPGYVAAQWTPGAPFLSAEPVIVT
ncbi:MAG: S-layer homology domain-containing protein [Oscillospiraceae bacterium]|nr:S-layer homology domain-containing protein [Oscillospiraceae bacterium]